MPANPLCLRRKVSKQVYSWPCGLQPSSSTGGRRIAARARCHWSFIGQKIIRSLSKPAVPVTRPAAVGGGLISRPRAFRFRFPSQTSDGAEWNCELECDLNFKFFLSMTLQPCRRHTSSFSTISTVSITWYWPRRIVLSLSLSLSLCPFWAAVLRPLSASQSRANHRTDDAPGAASP